MDRGRGGSRPGSLDLGSYHQWTRDASVSFAFLLPLLAIYEIGLRLTDPRVRNAADWFLTAPPGLRRSTWHWFHWCVMGAVLVVLVDLLRRRVPVHRLFPLFLLESLVCALLLGPLVDLLVHGFRLQSPASGDLLESTFLSIGAGAYEEILFRFLGLAGTYAALHRGIGIGRRVSWVSALLFSSVAFAFYHHIGPLAEPLQGSALLFRFLAGIVLGVLFTGRGLALCAYLHALYDILVELKHGFLLP